MKINRKDGIVYERKDMRGKETMPDKETYQNTINKLATDGKWDCLIAVRMGCELGLARIDIVNAEIKNIDRNHKRSLWIAISKMVRRGGSQKAPTFKMRSRDMPVNSSLYSLLMNYVDKDTKFILKRKKGSITKPFGVQRINDLYKEENIRWSPHKSRHYFRTQLKRWFREEKGTMDDELVNSLMGHRPKNVSNTYGIIDWGYKQRTIDMVFK